MSYDLSTNQIIFIFAVALWDLLWKGAALWRAAHRNQRNWFIALLLINSAGILPIIYLLKTDFRPNSGKEKYVTTPVAQRS